jgi:hypothetical protein
MPRRYSVKRPGIPLVERTTGQYEDPSRLWRRLHGRALKGKDLTSVDANHILSGPSPVPQERALCITFSTISGGQDLGDTHLCMKMKGSLTVVLMR